jgi:DNA-binding NarL/FixJ family response regulator
MLRALIVEDNDSFRLLFGKFLQGLCPDMLIDEALDGCRVVELVDIMKPDIVFMDINLPGANGLFLTQKIKSIHPQTPVVIVTSHDQPEYMEAAKAAGADHFFSKDALDRIEIKAIVSALLAKHPTQFLPKPTRPTLDRIRLT